MHGNVFVTHSLTVSNAILMQLLLKKVMKNALKQLHLTRLPILLKDTILSEPFRP